MADLAVRVRRVLDGYPSGGETPRLALLDFDVAVRTPTEDLARYLTGLYAPLQVAGTAEHLLTLTTNAGIWSVHLDATRVITTPAPSIAFSFLLWEANHQAIDRTSDRVLVHASAAEFDGAAIVLPGPMGAGKSTLVASLVRAGLGYLTDEVVALDPSSGLIRPYPKYLSLGGALGDLAPAPPESVRPFVGEQHLVPPDAIRSGALGAPVRPRLVVTPRYERGATTTVEPLGPAEAVSTLAQHAFHIERDGQRTLDVLARVVEASSCYRLVSGDIDEATAALLELTRAVAHDRTSSAAS